MGLFEDQRAAFFKNILFFQLLFNDDFRRCLHARHRGFGAVLLHADDLFGTAFFGVRDVAGHSINLRIFNRDNFDAIVFAKNSKRSIYATYELVIARASKSR